MHTRSVTILKIFGTSGLSIAILLILETCLWALSAEVSPDMAGIPHFSVSDQERTRFEPDHISFENQLLIDMTTDKADEGLVWGGAFLLLGTGITVYGFLERDIYYSQKDIERTIMSGDGLEHELHFTLYKKTHANPHTALFTSIGLFLNGSYWLLKERVDGVDLEEYSTLFSERNMAYYSIILGTIITTAAFLVPEYSDEVRRGYLIQTDSAGEVQYYPVQDERRLYSYRQASVNAAAGLVYLGFGLWKLIWDESPTGNGLNRTGQQHVTTSFSCQPLLTPNSLWLHFRF
ncbi:hypothetical protein JXQ70_17745 [bacterium]|nr:hypothetical protein [bacterium]